VEIRDYIEANGAGKIAIISINWLEDLYGASPGRLERMVGNIHPSIRVVAGNAGTGRDFGGVHSIPAIFVFDGTGREVFRLGGDMGPNGRYQLRRERLEKVIDGLK
jgi:hypothetical protein